MIKPEAVLAGEVVNAPDTSSVLRELGEGTSIAAIFERRVSAHPHGIAVQTPEHDFTYGEVNRWANRLAHCLNRELASNAGPVALWLEDALAVSASLMGIWKVGRAFVSGNFHAPESYNRELFAMVRPAAVLTSRAGQVQVLSIVPPGTRILCWEDLATESNQKNPGLTVPPDAVLRIVFTSGSAGRPKGVEHDQQCMLQEACSAIAGAGYHTDDRFLQLSSLSHVNGSDWLLYVFMLGATLSCYPLRSWGVERLGEWVETKGITRFVTVPTVFRRFVRLPNLSSAKVASIRVVHLGGEPVRPDDVRRFQVLFAPGSLLIANIGSTEAGSFARCIFDTTTPVPGTPLPLGWAHPGIHLEIRDEQDQAVPPGEVGEIVVYSRGVARGYFGQSELTESGFGPDPRQSELRRFRTGDLGWFDADGLLHSAGRRDRQVKIRGHRVELREIEDRVVEFPGVTNVVVRACSGETMAMQLVAYFSLEPEVLVTAQDLRNWLRDRLPHYMVPGRFQLMREWPTLASGKIDREAVAKTGGDSWSSPGTDGNAVSRTEAKLIEIWRRVFGIEDVEPEDNFFALGGDSLHATSLLADVEVEWGKRLSLEAILATPTLHELAGKIDETSEVAGNFVPLGGGKGPRVLFLLHGWGGTVTPYLDLAHSLRFDGPVVGVQGDEQCGGTDRPDTVPRLADRYAQLIVSAYPEKRYILMGHSAGGVLAFAVASALRARGAPVELLITLDSRPNGVSLKQRSGMMWPYVRSRLLLHGQTLRKLRIRAAGTYVAGRIRAALHVAHRVARPVPSGLDHYVDLLSRHRLTPCPIPTAVVQCDQTWEQLMEGWRPLTEGNAREYLIHGTHHDILKGDQVVQLAGLIARIVGDLAPNQSGNFPVSDRVTPVQCGNCER